MLKAEVSEALKLFIADTGKTGWRYRFVKMEAKKSGKMLQVNPSALADGFEKFDSSRIEHVLILRFVNQKLCSRSGFTQEFYHITPVCRNI